ncbi:uncharacterized protein LOC133192611 [Saccostrea echinata]|uniref:uncharacterized protein LOC133192611 n=1 Tax=Saccostrea echinata TaxID=191078 RepID=UPI002A81E4BC|nr:uncharacterized protein LOC133192611 [Saccostrea echinata]
MNSRLFAVICITHLFVCSICDTQESTVEEGSGTLVTHTDTHTDRVPVIDEELVTTQAPKQNHEQAKSDLAPVSGTHGNRETASLNLVFIIVPAVVGVVVIVAVVIAIIAIRRKTFREKMLV